MNSSNNYTYKTYKQDFVEYHAPINVVLFFKIHKVIIQSIQYLGLVGNLFAFVVYFQGNLRKLSVSTYLRCLAVCCACHNLLFLHFDYYIPFYVLNNSEILCRLRVFSYFYLPPLCAWLEVAASLDRLLTIVFPIRFRFLRKPPARRRIIVSLVILNAFFYGKFIILNQLYFPKESFWNGASHCVILTYKTEGNLDFLNGAAVPFTFMMTFTMLTFVGVVRAHKSIHLLTRDRFRQQRTRDIRFGITMIILNLIFVLFNLPYRMFYVLDWSCLRWFKSWEVFNAFREIVYLFYETYYSIPFYVHLVVNSQVRKEFAQMFPRAYRLLRRS